MSKIDDFLATLDYNRTVVIPEYISKGIIVDSYHEPNIKAVIDLLKKFFDRIVPELSTPLPQVWTNCLPLADMVDAISRTGLFQYKKDIRPILKYNNDTHIITNREGVWKIEPDLRKTPLTYTVDLPPDKYDDLCNIAMLTGIEEITRNFNYEVRVISNVVSTKMRALYKEMNSSYMTNNPYCFKRVVNSTQKFFELDPSDYDISTIWLIESYARYILMLENSLHMNSFKLSDSMRNLQSELDKIEQLRYILVDYYNLLVKHIGEV